MSQDKESRNKVRTINKLTEETKLKMQQLKEQQKLEIEEALKEITTSKENLDQEQQLIHFEVIMWIIHMYINFNLINFVRSNRTMNR